MNYVHDYHNIDYLPAQSLTITQCGYQQCHGEHRCGQFHLCSSSVTFVLRGRGIYSTGGQDYQIGPGQGFAMFKGETVSYRSDPDDPWSYIYAIVSGVDCETLFRKAGLDKNHLTFEFEQSDAMTNELQAMYEASRSNEAGGYDALGYFLLVMSRLIRREAGRKKTADAPDFHLQSAVAYISDHYPYHITLGDIAKYLNIDRTYLHRLFIRRFGISPMRWLSDFRLQKAVGLMDRPGVTMSEIALSTGFYDLSHFNRAFTDKYGVTPGCYKNKNHPDKPEDREKNK